MPPYTKEQFLDIAVKICPKLKEETPCIIGEKVWKQGSKDIMDSDQCPVIQNNFSIHYTTTLI